MSLRFEVIPYNTLWYRQMVHLRYEVLRRPLGLSFTVEQLVAESEQLHLACFDNGGLVACLILQLDKPELIKMRQVAVVSSLQGQGIGTKLCLFAEQIAIEKGAKMLYCHARKTAVRFYEKMGYSCIGNQFEEVGIAHYYMQKALN